MAVPLSYASPSEVAKALQSVGTADIVVFADDKQGLLILGGTSAELSSAVEAVRLFDRSGLEESKIRFFELQQAPARTVAEDLQRLLETSGISGASVVPLKRLNGLFVFAQTDKALDRIAGWVAKLDTPSKERVESLWVYHPRNVDAVSLSDTLNSVINGQTGTGQAPNSQTLFGQPGGGPMSSDQTSAGQTTTGQTVARGSTASTPRTRSSAASETSAVSVASTDEEAVRVGVDKETNTLLISAPASRWVQIQKILNEIDTPPNQVLIEASILEVTLTEQNNFGIDWSTLSAGGRLTAGAIGSSTGTVAANFPGFSVTYLTKNIQAAINALASQSAVEVISSPKIVVVDNQTARLDVGDQVPVVTQTGQSTVSAGSPILNSITYLSTGVILSVTPRISGDDRIFLDIDQEVSSAAETTTSGIDSPTIQQRTLTTTLILDNGAVAAFGGLISSNRTKTATGVPYLQKLPGVGTLFRTTQTKLTRDELIVLITATIIKDRRTSQKVLNDLLSDMHEIGNRGMMKP
jgi:general secretion pathway protein D